MSAPWTVGEVRLLKELCSKRMTWAERSRLFRENGYIRSKNALKCRAEREGFDVPKTRHARHCSDAIGDASNYADWIIGYTEYTEQTSPWR